MGGFRDDPDWPLVAALEVFDDDTQAARPAAIFTQRIVAPPPLRLGVDTAAEAVAVCLDEAGRLDVERIAELLGTDPAAARAELAGLAFEDPTSHELVAASAHLSGNVRTKLATARAAAATDACYEANAAALDEVLPRQLDPGEITAGLGAQWIPPGDVEEFCADVLGAEVEIERLAAPGSWTVRLHSGGRGSVSLSSEWGTARADAIVLLDAGLNQRLYTVYDEDEDADGRRVRNDAETLAARDKQEAVAVRFSAWVGRSRSGRPGWPIATTSCSAAWCCRRMTVPTSAFRAWPARSPPIPTSATRWPASSPTAGRCWPMPWAPARPQFFEYVDREPSP